MLISHALRVRDIIRLVLNKKQTYVLFFKTVRCVFCFFVRYFLIWKSLRAQLKKLKSFAFMLDTGIISKIT